MGDDRLNATAASLLGFLETQPMSGYDLATRIDRSVGRFWNTTQSQIYRELAVLSTLGFVSAGAERGTRARRTYTITTAGRTAFREWISQSPGGELVRMPLILTVFFGDRLPPGRLAAVLREHRARHQALVDEYARRLPALEAASPYRAATMRYGLRSSELMVEWIDEVLSHEPEPDRRTRHPGRTRPSPS